MNSKNQRSIGSRPVVFIGIPGSGKTTLAEKVAQKLGRVFIDGDRYIHEQTGKDSAEAFTGLTYTQTLDAETEIFQTIEPENKVIALPGSSGLTQECRELIISWNALVIRILVEPHELEKRLLEREDGITRIHFGDGVEHGDIPGLIAHREPEYAKIPAKTIDTTHLGIQASVSGALGLILT